jgi:class 3 adenylate cyclase
MSGVSALTVGTITVLGDAVRLNARLVATDTGRTISAAAVTVPRTQTVADLLGRPVASGPDLWWHGPCAGEARCHSQ